MNTASVFLGLSLGSAVFAAAKATQQSVRMWKRHNTLTAYIISKFATPTPPQKNVESDLWLNPPRGHLISWAHPDNPRDPSR